MLFLVNSLSDVSNENITLDRNQISLFYIDSFPLPVTGIRQKNG